MGNNQSPILPPEIKIQGVSINNNSKESYSSIDSDLEKSMNFMAEITKNLEIMNNS